MIKQSKGRQKSEFSKSTKNILKNESLFHCSNPSCRKLILNDGIFAHIIAASSNGPRGSKLIEKNDIKKSSNGILLCYTCEKLIDDNADFYTVEILTKWKELNKKNLISIKKALFENEILKFENEILKYKNDIKNQRLNYTRNSKKFRTTIKELEYQLSIKNKEINDLSAQLKIAHEYIQALVSKIQEKISGIFF